MTQTKDANVVLDHLLRAPLAPELGISKVDTRPFLALKTNGTCDIHSRRGDHMKKLMPLIALLLLVGCPAQVSKTLASWEGHNVNELLASWGPPSQAFSDGRGGQVFVYAHTRSWIQPGSATTNVSASTYGNYTYGQATTIYRPAYVQGYTAYRMFWIDDTGTIYSWAWRGL